jgi:hypothetical protein
MSGLTRAAHTMHTDESARIRREKLRKESTSNYSENDSPLLAIQDAAGWGGLKEPRPEGEAT